MRILVDSCSYNCQNVGDLAMLTVAVSRFRELWPSASIHVITNAPDLVARHCGSVETTPVRGRRLLLDEHLLGPVRKLLPLALRHAADRVEDPLRVVWPRLFALSRQIKEKLRGRAAGDTFTFLNAIEAADLVVVNGAGILTDAFKENAVGILATLDLANRRGVPTALVGQGIGPINDPELRRRAAAVLPRARLIAVRESQASVPLLISLGVDPDRVVVTGDDAIETAFSAAQRRQAARSEPALPRIGINVRVAPYADVARETVLALGQVLRDAAKTCEAHMQPIPIAHHGGRMDVETLRELLAGTDDGGASLDTPGQVIEKIGECRVMVTGSYHGAVFALAQGIPVVALAKSQYYVDKMTGVAQQFGLGCEVVRLDEDDLPARLGSAIHRAWLDADKVRAPLLRAAADQIRRGRAAYERLRDSIHQPERCKLPGEKESHRDKNALSLRAGDADGHAGAGAVGQSSLGGSQTHVRHHQGIRHSGRGEDARGALRVQADT
jgi:polysaccharide pyruvyl transferase WcaK-like protein